MEAVPEFAPLAPRYQKSIGGEDFNALGDRSIARSFLRSVYAGARRVPFQRDGWIDSLTTYI